MMTYKIRQNMLVPVYDILNCGERKRFVANNKLVHNSDKINLQNLPSRGTNANRLKQSIIAPTGYKIIDADSAQIEARVLAWLAGQTDLVQAFAQGKDVYKIMAAAIYEKPENEVTKEERFYGKATILGAGFGMGALKFQAQLKTFGVDTQLDEARRIIDMYRTANDSIVRLWRDAQTSLIRMVNGEDMNLGIPIGVLTVKPKIAGIWLPSGLMIRYDGLEFSQGEKGVEFSYVTRRGRTRIYGGKIVENCIAHGTEVLTDNGWKPIEQVHVTDKVHDGVEFVSHGGVVFKSVQSCVSIDGVYMTPDHEVLTNDGWQAASQNPEPYRPDLWHINGNKPGTQQRKKEELAVSMPMREAMHKSWHRCNERSKARGQAELRVPYSVADSKGEFYSWDEQASSVCGMEKHARPVQAIISSSLGKLWGSWHNSMSTMARGVREFLGGYGWGLSTGVGSRSGRQQQGVFQRELSLGIETGKHDEQTQYGTQGGYSSLEQGNWYRAHNTILPTSTRLACGAINSHTQSEKQVYDILNAGPRTRFVVRGGGDPFIVHNCTQAIARCIIAEQMLRIAKRYKVVLTVHDAVACVVRDEEVQEATQFVEECMRWAPDWAQGLPLNCESGSGDNYGAC